MNEKTKQELLENSEYEEITFKVRVYKSSEFELEQPFVLEWFLPNVTVTFQELLEEELKMTPRKDINNNED